MACKINWFMNFISKSLPSIIFWWQSRIICMPVLIKMKTISLLACLRIAGTGYLDHSSNHASHPFMVSDNWMLFITGPLFRDGNSCRLLWRRRNLHERCLRRKIDERKVVVKLNGRSCLRRRGVVTTFSAIATLSLESVRCRPEKHNFVNLSCRKMIGESGAKTETVANRFEFKFNWPQKHQQRQDGHLKKSFLIQIEWNFNVRRPTIVERDESLRKIEN